MVKLVVALSVVVAAALPVRADDGCKVAVMPLVGQGIDDDKSHVLAIATETMATEVATATGCVVITEGDIRSMIDYEAQKQQCGSSADSCLAEIGSALGVDFIVTGSLGKIGDVYTLNGRLIDTDRVSVVARVEETARNEGHLRVSARNAARGLFQLPPLDDEDAAGDSFRLTRALIFGGTAIGLIGAVVLVIGVGTIGASIGATQISTLGGDLKQQAFQTGVPLGAVVTSVGVLMVPVGVSVLGLGYVLE